MVSARLLNLVAQCPTCCAWSQLLWFLSAITPLQGPQFWPQTQGCECWPARPCTPDQSLPCRAAGSGVPCKQARLQRGPTHKSRAPTTQENRRCAWGQMSSKVQREPPGEESLPCETSNELNTTQLLGRHLAQAAHDQIRNRRSYVHTANTILNRVGRSRHRSRN